MTSLYNISEPKGAKQKTGFALFRLGFRPFFLFGAIFSVVALGAFTLWLSGIYSNWQSAWDALVWHRHEMLFGYTGAIIAGFLLTAVTNWTGHPTLRGKALAGAFGLWLAGRIAVFFSSHFPQLLVATIDCSFFAACAAGVAPALLKSKNKRNYFFIALLLIMSAANFLTHTYTGESPELAELGLRMELSVIIVIMVIIGGRVIPFFTERPLGINILRKPLIQRAVIASTIAALLAFILDAEHTLTGTCFAAAAIANLVLLSGWKSALTIRIPLLWILHTGYAWIVIGFAVKSLEAFGFDVPGIAATHAFTAGGIGALTLGMMARVSLGHTGRTLEVKRSMVIAFAAINLAALCRVFGVWFFASHTIIFMQIAAALWFTAFGIFVFAYAPVLIRPRVDGKEG